MTLPTMATDLTSAYLRTKVLSATPEELRLMLLDGCLRFCRQGREGLATRNFEQSYNGLSGAKNILVELVTGMNREINPELCDRVTAVLMFMYRRLVDANLEKSAEIVDEVIGLLEYERETWVLTMQKLADERARLGATPPGDPAPAAVQTATDAARPQRPAFVAQA